MGTKTLSGLIAVSWALLGAQQPGQKSTPSEGTPESVLDDVSSLPVPSLGTQLLAMPQVCTSDGSVFAQTATTSTIGDLTSISADGKTVINFGVQKINDLKNPQVWSFFVSAGDVYLLLSTHEAEQMKDANILQPDGGVKKVKTPVVSGKRYAIARFKTNGTYLGSISLDVPFTPQQIGAFPTGDFLVSGIKTYAGAAPQGEAQLALVASSGQFLKLIELKRDPNAQTPENTSTVGAWFMSTSLSEIVADGSELLLVRPTKNTPVFSVSSAGETTALNLDIPEGYALHDLKVSGVEWIGLIARDVSETDSQLLSFDRSTGKAIARYVYPPRVGFALACVNPSVFTFVTLQEDSKMTLTKLARH